MKNKTSNDLFVVNFVQAVSAYQTHAKRVNTVRKLMQMCPKNLTIIQWMKLWRGFYYVVWYEEMRKGGEEFITEMGSSDNASFLLSGFKSLADSWSGIDAFRIDKYMYLVRIMLRNVIDKQIKAILNKNILFENDIFMKNHQESIKSKDDLNHFTLNNDKEHIHQLIEIKANVIDYIISVSSQSVGLFLHICDIYLDELKLAINNIKFNDEEIKSTIYQDMLIPYIKWLALIKDERMLKSIYENIFKCLLDKSLLDETFLTRKIVLKGLYGSFLNFGGMHSSSSIYGGYRIKIMDEYKKKMDEWLCGELMNKTKRKIIGFDRKTKRIRYEMTTQTPFVRSIIPLPLV